MGRFPRPRSRISTIRSSSAPASIPDQHRRHRRLRRPVGGPAIHEFACDRRSWFARSLDLSNGIPSDDPIGRVLARLDLGMFEKCLLSWVQAVQEATANPLIATDGKTLRGADERRDGKATIHLVSAWTIANTLSLGQVVVDEKSNEITAIPELLLLLDVSGAVVTIDAMGCQKEIAAQIRQGGIV
ncbi:MAG: ISAs1 family transposase [Planctomycetaceae bacterium]|nr:ISAs1 family transposase [Planctomycetaceae bacterium]